MEGRQENEIMLKTKKWHNANNVYFYRRVDRTERRLLDEFYKMFLEADSFYYSCGYDIFNTLQRQMIVLPNASDNDKENSNSSPTQSANINQKDKNQNDKVIQIPSKTIWKKADERFFWNRYMVSEIIESQVKLVCNYLS